MGPGALSPETEDVEARGAVLGVRSTNSQMSPVCTDRKVHMVPRSIYLTYWGMAAQNSH